MIAAADWTPGTGWDVNSTNPGKATKIVGVASYLINAAGVAAIANQLYETRIDFVRTDAYGYIYMGNNIVGAAVNATGSHIRTGWAVNTDKGRLHAVATTAGTFDNFSIKPITITEAIARRNYGRQVAIAAPVSLTAGMLGGVVWRYSDDNNFGVCYHNGSNAVMAIFVNGVRSELINSVAAYGAARIVEVRWADANTAQLWYHGSQIGANQNTSALPAGTWAGLFGTNSGVSIGNPVVT
jgi:hypothetical protein